METIATQTHIDSIEGYAGEKPRGEPMYDVKVVVRPNRQALPGGYVASKGQSTVRVYKSDYEALRRMVAPDDPAMFESAAKVLEKEWEKYSESTKDPTELERLKKTFPLTIETVLFKNFHYETRPLASAEIVTDKEGKPLEYAAPSRETERREMAAFADVLGDKLCEGNEKLVLEISRELGEALKDALGTPSKSKR